MRKIVKFQFSIYALVDTDRDVQSWCRKCTAECRLNASMTRVSRNVRSVLASLTTDNGQSVIGSTSSSEWHTDTHTHAHQHLASTAVRPLLTVVSHQTAWRRHVSGLLRFRTVPEHRRLTIYESIFTLNCLKNKVNTHQSSGYASSILGCSG